MIPDAGCPDFDKESIYSDLGFDKAAPFCKNYTKFYFDAKHLEKEFNRGGRFLVPFFQNNFPFS